MKFLLYSLVIGLVLTFTSDISAVEPVKYVLVEQTVVGEDGNLFTRIVSKPESQLLTKRTFAVEPIYIQPIVPQLYSPPLINFSGGCANGRCFR